MMHTWKLPHMVKGSLTHVPLLNAWRMRRGSTGGTNSIRYCYAVWLRHLVVLNRHGFRIDGATVGEVGPGDSVGTGVAALLSGAHRYVGLDRVPFSATVDIGVLLDELSRLFLAGEPIPSHDEFPGVRPRLDRYEFPTPLLRPKELPATTEKLKIDFANGIADAKHLSYVAPWSSVRDIPAASLDVIFSQAVLQFADDLALLYRAMFSWLKPGGYGSHSIGCSAMYLSPFWNGHWAYSDTEWRIVRGRRAYLHNREPASAHIALATSAGFEVLSVEREHDSGGLPVSALAPRFQTLDRDDLHTRGMMLLLRKPH